jgi:UrcA family protein
MFRSILLASVVTVAAFGAAGAHAQQRTDDQLSVSVHNVDYNNPDKVSQMYGRLQAAAKSVCDSDGDQGPLAQQADKACESETLRDAVAQVGQPQLSQLAEARMGRSTQLAMRDRHDADARGTR